MKETFIKNEIWNLTIAGAFQRANVYSNIATIETKNKFKSALFNFIDIKSSDYFSKISDDSHIKNIQSISDFSKKYINILNNKGLNFGISQKLLNLFLKYLWCLDKLPIPPPHFPIDRIIQGELIWKELCAWTQMEDEIKYLEIINHAKQVAIKEGFESIAHLEVYLFKRKNSYAETK